ncbi:hypothetical protein D3C73_1420050 [compost metagenome]
MVVKVSVGPSLIRAIKRVSGVWLRGEFMRDSFPSLPLVVGFFLSIMCGPPGDQ